MRHEEETNTSRNNEAILLLSSSQGTLSQKHQWLKEEEDDKETKKEESTLSVKKEKLGNNFTNRIGPYIFHLRTAFERRTSFQSHVCVLHNETVPAVVRWVVSHDAPEWLAVFGAWCAVLVSVHRFWVLSLWPYSRRPPSARLRLSDDLLSQYGYCFCFFPAKQDSQVHSSMAPAAPAPVQ